MKNLTAIIIISLMILPFTYSIANRHLSGENSKSPPQLQAMLQPTKSHSAIGTVTFRQVDESQIEITIVAAGLKANSEHAIHIHEFGDISEPDGSSAGGHFNPTQHPHGLPTENKRHAGDLGNIKADRDGIASKTIQVDNISLIEGPNAIVGRAVVIHEEMDKGTQPSGDAGSRIAVGVIGVQQS